MLMTLAALTAFVFVYMKTKFSNTFIYLYLIHCFKPGFLTRVMHLSKFEHIKAEKLSLNVM